MRGRRRSWGARAWRVWAAAALIALTPASASAASAASPPSSTATVWLCRPGLPGDPCTASLATTVVSATGARSTTSATPARSSRFACFYAYGTVSTEPSTNADLRRGDEEVESARVQASPFSPLCRIWAPIYRQVTVAGLRAHPDLDVGPAATATAYDSIRAGFEDFLAHRARGRPFVVVGDSQGAAMLDLLLERLVDDVPAARARLVAAVILGGNVEVPAGRLVGGTFRHIPACDRLGESGCAIAYSSFPSTPPRDALFGRPGQGVSLQSGQTATSGLQVVCTNPAALAGGAGALDPVFPSLGAASTPWVAYPGRYTARCEQGDGASWLEVAPATGGADRRPTVAEDGGPAFGYHLWDLGLAQGDLVRDVAAAEAGWARRHP
jgi:hypothetical protein